MANSRDEPPKSNAGGDSASASGLIFVSDASAEAARLTVALRSRGYPTVDVPLGLLAARITVQEPALILCDADATGVLEVIEGVLPGRQTQVVFLADPEGALAIQPERLKKASQSIFIRPVEVYSLLRKIEALIGAPPEGVLTGALQPKTRTPVLVAAARKPYMVDASHSQGQPASTSERPAERAAVPSSLPPDVWPNNDRWQVPTDISLEGLEDEAQLSLLPEPPRPPQELSARSPMSPELAALLQEAEQRLEHKPLRDLHKQRLSPEAEIDAVLPPEVLASLDEPLDDDDDFEVDLGPGTKSGSEAGGTSPGTEGGHKQAKNEPESEAGRATNPGGTAPASPHPVSHSLTATNTQTPPTDRPPARPTPIPGSIGYQATTAVGGPQDPEHTTAGGRPTTPPMGFLGSETGEEAPPSTPPQPLPTSRPPRLQRSAAESIRDPIQHEPSPASTTDSAGKADTESTGRPPARDVPAGFPRPLGDGIARSSVAKVVRQRLTGAMVFENNEGVRRIVFRDGDFVTAASGVVDESLVAFLAVRGDLNPDAATQLKRRLPPFGRHAGAALIANGHLKQDELWSVLRSHAEWIIGRLIQLETGHVDWETDVPERLSSEPAVFGGSTGAEVFVETLRRVAASDKALAYLGGPGMKLAHGPQFDLLSECALAPAEVDLVRRIAQLTVSDLQANNAPQDFSTVCLALVELGVLTHASAANAEERSREPELAKADPLDDRALRARVAARFQLVQEGDYFALLGVPRSATSYEIQKAHTNLKAELSPERVLTARNVDLQDQLQTILEVVDEAYEILGDQLRRDRYRRALEALPS